MKTGPQVERGELGRMLLVGLFVGLIVCATIAAETYTLCGRF